MNQPELCTNWAPSLFALTRVAPRLQQKYTLRDVKGVCLKEVVVSSYSESPMD